MHPYLGVLARQEIRGIEHMTQLVGITLKSALKKNKTKILGHKSREVRR